MVKSIKVSDDVHQKLMLFKYRRKFTTVDDTILSLLKEVEQKNE